MENKFPRKTEKPWGYELLFARTLGYAGKVIFVKKGHRLSLQYHEKKHETLYIHLGRAIMEIGVSDRDMETLELGPGQCIEVPHLTRHRLKALEDTTLFEVSTSELEDVVRLADDYGRAGNG